MNKFKIGLATVAMALSPLVITAPADAATTYFRNCDSLHHVFKYGVAKSERAARRQVRDGYHKPAYGPRAHKVYWRNYTRLDRDRDGTACEA